MAVNTNFENWVTVNTKIKVLFVCMGNICRSPTAEAVFRHYVENAGLTGRILIDSAGTHDYHIGEAPDARTQRAAQQRGYDMSALRGRQVEEGDFQHFDYVLAMDRANLAILQSMTPADSDTRARLFLEYACRHAEREVPDPYYGNADGFERVLDMVEDAAQGLLQEIRQQYFLA
ncbi:MAG: low molecular weight phosphotyrosine protein phosphatase [Nitrosomonadales bacterium]|nr:low molecular weight phosphotyrosine protein phosphatase [Nitrosomonadales bacterium]